MVDIAENFCLVVYDVADDAVRYRISEACLDYGLERFQMSAFWGHLTASRRKELFLRAVDLLGKSPGRILVQPVCKEDLGHRHVLHQRAEPSCPDSAEPGKKHRDFPEPGRQKPTIIKL